MTITVRELSRNETTGAIQNVFESPSASDIFAMGADMLLLASENGAPIAQCSLWWSATPLLPGGKAGFIGHFQATSAEAAMQLLNTAAATLRSRGCFKAIGPIDGSTWRNYRLVVERGTEPPFFLEPQSPAEYPDYFSKALFREHTSYFSALATDLGKRDPLVAQASERLAQNGVSIREIDMSNFDAELRLIYAVSTLSFSKNYLYTPISEGDFLLMYRKLQNYIDPRLSLMADRGRDLVGFLFSLPDLLRDPRDTVILKTTAVLPGLRNGGLGNVLVAECHERARAYGFKRVIHALMHESNSSRNLSSRYAVPFRRYALFDREL